MRKIAQLCDILIYISGKIWEIYWGKIGERSGKYRGNIGENRAFIYLCGLSVHALLTASNN